MFLRLCQANEFVRESHAKENAVHYINRARLNAIHFSMHRDERRGFLRGNAGIYAVAAAISDFIKEPQLLHDDLKGFETGFDACSSVHVTDEMMIGRAGFLCGIYWLNQTLKPEPFDNDRIIEVCDMIVQKGKKYHIVKRSPLPLMYQYHNTEYLGKYVRLLL